MQRVMLRCTNIKARAIRLGTGANHYNAEFDFDEFSAGISLLLRAGVDRDNFTDLDDLWSIHDSKPFYRATMSVKRFKFFLRCLRCDDYRTRRSRLKDDKLAAFRDIWSLFLDRLRRFYTPDFDLTIDEQLVGYRGHIPGRTYLPSKPRKYGIKIFWMCEATTGYALNAVIYTGRENGHVHRNLAMDIVLQLTHPYNGSGRNICCDNYFTSHALALRLLENNLTILGTLRLHRREIPEFIHSTRGRAVMTSRFAFDHDANIVLVSYLPKKNKNVVLLSSSHCAAQVEGPQNKPSIILQYNSIKGGVDTLDENVERFTCRRKTVRWPLLLLYNTFDVAVNNAFLLFKKNRQDATDKKTFIRNLTMDLARPAAERRLTRSHHQYTKEAAQKVGFQLSQNNPTRTVSPHRGVGKCFECRKSSRSICDKCSRYVCPSHRREKKSTKCVTCFYSYA